MFSRAFIRDAAERAISTFAQALIAAVLVDGGTGLTAIHWPAVLSVAGLATLLSVLKGVAAYKLGDNETGASLLSEAPPRVEAGTSQVLLAAVVVIATVLVLAVVGVVNVR